MRYTFPRPGHRSRKKNIVTAAIIISTLSFFFTDNMQAAVIYLPDVTNEMTEASYWTGKLKTTGAITIKKGLKKGTYPIRIKVTASGDKNHKAASNTRTGRIVVYDKQ